MQGYSWDRFDFIDGALLDLPEEQAQRLMDRRTPGMTIEEDFVINWIKDSSALNSLNRHAAQFGTKKTVPMAAAANVVSSVYINVRVKIFPDPFEPNVANVVMTASTIVGTANNWNSRV